MVWLRAAVRYGTVPYDKIFSVLSGEGRHNKKKCVLGGAAVRRWMHLRRAAQIEILAMALDPSCTMSCTRSRRSGSAEPT